MSMCQEVYWCVRQENVTSLRSAIIANLHLVGNVLPSATATVQQSASPTDANVLKQSWSVTLDVIPASHATTNKRLIEYNGKCVPH